MRDLEGEATFRPLPAIHTPIVLRVGLVAAGSLFVALAVAGMLLPLLPTTVFLLLAAGCYARSSERAYAWLHTNRLFGSYLRNYREKRGMSLVHKAVTVALLWGGMGVSAYLLGNLWVDVVLLVIAVGVTIHLVMIPTLSRERSR